MVSKGGDFLDEQGKFTVPEGFITPDTSILQHSANREAYYFDMMLNALCVSKQNMTNQSGIKTLLCILTIVLGLIDLTKLEITITNKETLTTLFG